ncbi:MAG: glycosyltransferase family 4 protein [Myxococcales bacterium]|nr:glycosyltransferase family 4 protein [Myxococcales bacterium]
MKLLHLTADWKWTGPAEPMLHAVTGLRTRGHKVDLVCPDGPPGEEGTLLERALERGVTPPLLLERARGVRLFRDLAEVRRLRELIHATGYEVVHVHHARDHLLARRALGFRGRRAAALVASWHHGDPLPLNPANRWLFGPRSSDALCVLGASIGERAREALGFAENRVAVLPGVVDLERFRPHVPDPALRRAFGLESGQRVVGVVARLQPHRRFDLLLEAFRRALRDAPELRLIVIGRGTRARQVLHAPVARLGLGDAVISAGYREADFPAVLGLFDALVFLVPGSDGSCRAVLEAMATGVPVIASRRGLLPEIVADGSTGVLCDEEAGALAKLMVDVVQHPVDWAVRGKAARERARARYALPLHAARLERFYASLGSSTS